MASATAGKDPMITTKITARSFSPNQRIARGSQAIDGSDWSPITRLPKLRSNRLDPTSRRPNAVPAPTEMANPIRSRTRLADVALGRFPLAMLWTSVLQTDAGEGSTSGSKNPVR